MKTSRLIPILLLALAVSVTNAGTAWAGKKSDMKVAYVLKNLGVKADTQTRLKPLLQSYLADKKAANKDYDELKDRLKPSIKNGTLTEKQAQQLLSLKWQADERELAVKRQYEQRFRTVLSARKTYLTFDLLNDKQSKVEGRDKE